MKEENVQFPGTALLILAAGAGRRFGSLKQLALVDDVPLLRRVILRTLSPAQYHTVVVLGSGSHEIAPVVSDLPVTIVHNTTWEQGLSTSIRQGILCVENTWPALSGLMIMPGDLWKLGHEHLEKLLEISELNPGIIVATGYSGHGGAPAFFPRQFWPDLLLLEGDAGASIYLQHTEGIVLVDIPEAHTDLDFTSHLPGDGK